MPSTYKENVAGLILEWVELNERDGILLIFEDDLDIAVLASRISKLKDTN